MPHRPHHMMQLSTTQRAHRALRPSTRPSPAPAPSTRPGQTHRTTHVRCRLASWSRDCAHWASRRASNHARARMLAPLKQVSPSSCPGLPSACPCQASPLSVERSPTITPTHASPRHTRGPALDVTRASRPLAPAHPPVPAAAAGGGLAHLPAAPASCAAKPCSASHTLACNLRARLLRRARSQHPTCARSCAQA